jgi:hypothetical protein
LLCVQNLSVIVSSFMQAVPVIIRSEASNSLWFQFSRNRHKFSILSGFGTIRLLSIRISKVLFEEKLLSFATRTSSRNSHNFQGVSEIILENVFRN